ncbi:hypothetical protein [Spirosoma luteum]|uniref:hypothetical protein n=1 Tax=Spirosoma luteum TaxID=431553 RepID=UPI00037E40D1|nr:hypothetical protein [Spirosoma luteum]
MSADDKPIELPTDKVDSRRAARSAIIWLLIGLGIGLIMGYLLYALRNDTVQQQYEEHLLRYHNDPRPPA